MTSVEPEGQPSHLVGAATGDIGGPHVDYEFEDDGHTRYDQEREYDPMLEDPVLGDDHSGGVDLGDNQAGETTGEVVAVQAPRSAKAHRSAKSRHRRRVVAVLLSLFVVVIVVGIVGFFRVSGDINPGGKPGRLVTVYIPKGSSTGDIGRILSQRGIIHGGSTVFEVYVKLSGAGPLLAGTYQFHQNLPYSTVVNALQAGPSVAVYKLVVPEGFTVNEMAAAVAHLHVGITAAQFEQAARDGQVRSSFEPAGTRNLEGLLFPATYPVHPGETADELVQYMASTFDQEATSIGLAQAAKKLGYTPYQVVEVASIVEREAKLDQDRAPIASVIYNRLARGMDIGAQSTLLYGLGNPKGHVSIYTPNLYNTQVHNGLPPTPIASPGVPSLEAAMHPAHTDDLYWVEINPDGKMGFASNTSGFARLQAECRAVKLGC